MTRNITTFRQSLKAVDAITPSEVNFEGAREYYSLFPLGAEVKFPADVALVELILTPA